MMDDPNNENPQGDAFAEQLDALYQSMLGRSPSQAEIDSHRGNPGGIEGVRQTIVGSPEYQARQPGKPGPTPTPTQTTNTGGPAPGPTTLSRDAFPITPTPTPTPTPAPAPTLNAPAYTPPPAFNFRDFEAPTANDVFDDPGYQFRMRQGEDALNKSAAARGVLNTGGTLQDVLGFGQDLASQEYGNIFNRRAQEYSMDRSNALDTYNTNYQTEFKDPYQINYQTQYADPFNAKQHNYDQGLYYDSHNQDQSRYYDSHNQDQNRYYQFANQQFDYNKTRNQKLDDFEMRYRLLGLI